MTDLVVIVSDVQLLVSPEIALTSILSILHFSYYTCGREEEWGVGGGRQRGMGGSEEGGGRREECNGKYTTYMR